MPGRPITDQQMRRYMDLRRTHSQLTAAAKAGVSVSTAYRIEKDPRLLPSQKTAGRRPGRSAPDPFAAVWESDILPLLQTCPGLRPITILEELQRRHPERDWEKARRTLPSPVSRSLTGSITSRSPIPAGRTPRSYSAAKASWR